MEPGAPDNIRDVENAAVLEHRLPILCASGSCHAFDASSLKVFRLDSYERPAHRQQLAPELAADRRIHREHAMEQASEHESDQQQTSRESFDAEGHVANVPARIHVR